ncbi:MAG: ABC transporter permease [Gammaproteobacteria bacterium]|nr:ABC transporter permease [Gammaproteobacteria bacterium]
MVMREWLHDVGERAGQRWQTWLRTLGFGGSMIITVSGLLHHKPLPSLAQWGRVASQASVQALPIVWVVNALVGAIMAFVGAVQLQKFGAGLYVADLVGISVCREMAALITAVVMSGRTAAAFAAELATMRAQEEIDALHVLGLDPMRELVVPRVLVLVGMMPLLFFHACVAALVGGLVVATLMLDLNSSVYVQRLMVATSATHLFLGLAKALVFGAWIAMAGCFAGLHAERSAAGVGEASTRAVVRGIVGVIALDAVFAVVANAMSW